MFESLISPILAVLGIQLIPFLLIILIVVLLLKL